MYGNAIDDCSLARFGFGFFNGGTFSGLDFAVDGDAETADSVSGIGAPQVGCGSEVQPSETASLAGFLTIVTGMIKSPIRWRGGAEFPPHRFASRSVRGPLPL